MKKNDALKRVPGLFPHFWWDLISFHLIIAAGIATTIGTAILLRKSADAMGTAKDVIGVKDIIVTLTFLILLSGLIKFIQDYYPSKTMIKKSARLKEHIVEHLTKVDMSYLNVNKTGDIIARLKDVDEVADFLGYKGIESLSWVLASIACIIYVFTLSWKLTVMGFVSVPLVMILMSKAGNIIAGFSRKSKEVTSDINSFLLQAIEGNKEIKSFSLKQSISKEFNKISQDLRDYTVSSEKWNNIMVLIGDIGSLIPIGVVFLFGSYLIYKREMTIGAWASYFFLMEYTNSIFNYLPSLISGYKNMLVSVERMLKLVDLPEEQSGKEVELDRETSVIVEFKNVQFAYPDILDGGTKDLDGDTKEVLKGISFKVHKGEKLCIVGPSGCGKSTLFNLLLGFYPSYSGQIVYRGMDIKKLNLSVLRKDINLVDQVSYLFPESIAVNIAYGMGTESITADVKEKIKKASLIACADKFIEEMERGYETSVERAAGSFQAAKGRELPLLGHF